MKAVSNPDQDVFEVLTQSESTSYKSSRDTGGAGRYISFTYGLLDGLLGLGDLYSGSELRHCYLLLEVAHLRMSSSHLKMSIVPPEDVHCPPEEVQLFYCRSIPSMADEKC
ncbi:hypothetical protein AVEN_75966-1 [Araneus ventricosus]|uniref:Uncharacterized protein n=1 Tax=Araneus ventricosus TaxID=182803 RepID=A0A4Y2RQX4_ARAVE|nr:hypothetical protein AVEN_75966-1 [Araneus ventricosus]